MILLSLQPISGTFAVEEHASQNVSGAPITAVLPLSVATFQWASDDRGGTFLTKLSPALPTVALIGKAILDLYRCRRIDHPV